MNEDAVLSANVTIRAPISDVCDLRQLRAYKGKLDVSDEDAFRALVVALIAENGLSTMVGESRVVILDVEMEVSE